MPATNVQPSTGELLSAKVQLAVETPTLRRMPLAGRSVADRDYRVFLSRR